MSLGRAATQSAHAYGTKGVTRGSSTEAWRVGLDYPCRHERVLPPQPLICWSINNNNREQHEGSSATNLRPTEPETDRAR